MRAFGELEVERIELEVLELQIQKRAIARTGASGASLIFMGKIDPVAPVGGTRLKLARFSIKTIFNLRRMRWEGNPRKTPGSIPTSQYLLGLLHNRRLFALYQLNGARKERRDSVQEKPCLCLFRLGKNGSGHPCECQFQYRA